MTEVEARKLLELDGFTQIYVHKDGPNFEYPEHEHPVHTAHIILKGGMTIWQGGKERMLAVGERMDFEKGTPHTAKMGPEGCIFVTGIRI